MSCKDCNSDPFSQTIRQCFAGGAGAFGKVPQARTLLTFQACDCIVIGNECTQSWKSFKADPPRQVIVAHIQDLHDVDVMIGGTRRQEGYAAS